MLFERFGLPEGRETKAPVVLGITLVMFALAVAVVGLRLYSRIFVSRFLGADDWWMMAAMVFATGDQVLKTMWCFTGLGMHIKDVTPYDLVLTRKIGYAVVILYPISLGLVKLSVLTFYLRIFPSQKFRMVCFVSIGIVVALTVAVSLAQAFACRPVAAGWSMVTGGHCFKRAALQYAASIINLTTDLAILLLPMKYLWVLAVEPIKRYQTIIVFSLGLLTCVASAVRVSSINAFYNGKDRTYDAWPIATCSGIEINLAIITASLPSTKPFIVKYIWNPLTSRSSRHPEVLMQERGMQDRGRQDRGSIWTFSTAKSSATACTDSNYETAGGKNFDRQLQSLDLEARYTEGK